MSTAWWDLFVQVRSLLLLFNEFLDCVSSFRPPCNLLHLFKAGLLFHSLMYLVPLHFLPDLQAKSRGLYSNGFQLVVGEPVLLQGDIRIILHESLGEEERLPLLLPPCWSD